jgi:DNA-binding ferritin-like protein (Dps family)
MVKMTRRNKITIFSSIALAMIVILSIIVWAVSPAGQSTRENIPVVIYALIILASISSVFIVYFTKVRKNNYEKLLNKEYTETYQIIKDSISNSQLSRAVKREVIDDIVDLLLSAQKSGKIIGDVVGNPDDFTEDIFKSYAKPSHLAILSFFDCMIAFVLIILGASALIWFENTQQNFFAIELDISMTTFFVLVAFGLYPLTTRLTSTKNPWMFFIPLVAGVAFILSMELLRVISNDLKVVEQFLNGTIRMVPNAGIFVIYIISLPVLLLMKKLVRKRLLQS